MRLAQLLWLVSLASALLCGPWAPQTEAVSWRVPSLSGVWPLSSVEEPAKAAPGEASNSEPKRGSQARRASYQAEVSDYQPYVGYGSPVDAVSGLPSLRID